MNSVTVTSGLMFNIFACVLFNLNIPSRFTSHFVPFYALLVGLFPLVVVWPAHNMSTFLFKSLDKTGL